MQRASGIPHALFRAEGFSQDSGAARREAAKSYPKLGVRRHCVRTPARGGNAAAVFAVQPSAAGVEAVAMFVASIRSANLTIFWRCDHPRFSFRRGGARALATNRQRFWPRMCCPKGLAMLIRSEKYGVQGGAAYAVRPDAIPAASLPTLLLGGLLLLIGP